MSEAMAARRASASPGLDGGQGDPVLVDQVGGAVAAVDHAHERPELQPQGLDQAVEGGAAIGAVEVEMEGEIALHIGDHVAALHGRVQRRVDLA